MLSSSVIRQGLHIDKIHKNKIQSYNNLLFYIVLYCTPWEQCRISESFQILSWRYATDQYINIIK